MLLIIVLSPALASGHLQVLFSKNILFEIELIVFVWVVEPSPSSPEEQKVNGTKSKARSSFFIFLKIIMFN